MPVEKNKTYVGIVQDNNDPQKLGRVKIRVVGVFDQMDLRDIPWASPWKDLNGNGFNVPEVGKLLTVTFDSGNEYKPEYIYADFYNINLEKKIKSLGGENYASMKALIFDHKTQIYVNDIEGLKFDYKFNNINIKESQIDVSLKDNFGKVNLGDAGADQQAILGTSFLSWFDKFVNALMCVTGATPYIGAPLVPEPNFIRILQEYHLLKDPKFLSKNVYIVDNQCVTSVKNNTSSDPNLRVNDPQVGDNIKTNVVEMKVAPKTDEQKFEPAQGSGEEPTPRDQAASSAQVNSANPAQASLPGTEQAVQTPPVVPPVNSNSPVIPSPPPPPVEPKPAERVESILEAMRRQKDGSSGQFYVVEENPYVINLVGIRKTNEGQPYPNTFSDELWAIWKNEQGNWEHQKWSATTLPGLNVKITENSIEKTYLIKDKFAALAGSEFQETYSTKLKKVVSKGLPILVPAQYDLFEQSGNDEASGEFQGTHFLPKKCACYHDRNYGSTNITFSEPDDFFDKKIDTDCKGVGIFIGFIPTSDRRDLGFSSKSYKDSPHRQPTSVDTWSLGSIVIPNQNDWIQFKDLAIKSIKAKKSSSDNKVKASIKFTLLKESDLS